jgi:membrane protein required for colicin V production
LSWIDIALAIIIILGAVKGYREGFLMELFSLLGIVLGILGGFKLMGVVLIYLSDEFNIDKKILPYIAFAVVFILIVIGVTLIGKMLKASIDKSFLGRVDEGAGAALGLIKTVFLISVVLWLLDSVSYEFPEKWTNGSQIMPFVAGFAPQVTEWVGDLIPAFNDIF